jgi:hypothetical protein
MRKTSILLLVGVLLGYLGGSLQGPSGLWAQQTPSARSSTQAGSHAPLYPDAPIPNKAMQWRIDDLHKMYENRVAQARANKGTGGPLDPPFQTQLFRTHSMRPPLFRWRLETPRAGLSGVPSVHSDADQHQTVSDLTIFFGGKGQIAVDGEIQNRVFGSKAGPGGKAIVMPTEFNGQPIRNGHTYDVKAGDWVMIPPNVPHQYLAAPNEGLMYVNMKIFLGFTHPAIEYSTYSVN